MSSAWGFGVVCGFATSWGVDSATGGAWSTLVKGRGPGSELHISTS